MNSDTPVASIHASISVCPGEILLLTLYLRAPGGFLTIASSFFSLEFVQGMGSSYIYKSVLTYA